MKKQLLKNMLLVTFVATGLTSFAQSTLTQGFLLNDEGYDADHFKCTTAHSTTDGGVLEITPAVDAATTIDFSSTVGVDADTYKFVLINLKNTNTLINSLRIRLTDVTHSFIKASNITTGDASYKDYLYNLTAVTDWAGSNLNFNLNFRNSSGTDLSDLVSGDLSPVLFNEIIFSSVTLSETGSVFDQLNTIVSGGDGVVLLSNLPSVSTVEIFTITGQAVENNNLAAGVYLVKVTSNGQQLHKKVIVG